CFHCPWPQQFELRKAHYVPVPSHEPRRPGRPVRAGEPSSPEQRDSRRLGGRGRPPLRGYHWFLLLMPAPGDAPDLTHAAPALCLCSTTLLRVRENASEPKDRRLRG